MEKVIAKVEALLARTTVESGTSVHEAHTAAVIAERIARENGLGQLAARARVAAHKAQARVGRAA